MNGKVVDWYNVYSSLKPGTYISVDEDDLRKMDKQEIIDGLIAYFKVKKYVSNDFGVSFDDFEKPVLKGTKYARD